MWLMILLSLNHSKRFKFYCHIISYKLITGQINILFHLSCPSNFNIKVYILLSVFQFSCTPGHFILPSNFTHLLICSSIRRLGNTNPLEFFVIRSHSLWPTTRLPILLQILTWFTERTR